jgi:hypothetical protein
MTDTIEVIERNEKALVQDTLDDCMASLPNSTEKYFFDKTDVVRSVSAGLKNLPRGSRSITIIEREKSGEFYVRTVTIESSDVTGENTSPPSKG